MRRLLTILWFAFITIILNTTYAAKTPETNQQPTASPTWIEVGTVIGQVERTSYNEGYTSNGSNELKLYVMHLGDKPMVMEYIESVRNALILEDISSQNKL